MNAKTFELVLNFEDELASGAVDPQSLNYLKDVFTSFLKEELSIKTQLPCELNLNLMLVDAQKIKEINNEYRQKNKETDVLSFPGQDSIRAGEYEFQFPEEELGDIIVCSEVCQRQADEFSLSFIEEFLHLTVHGFLHVCGYDHEISDEEEKLMESLEERLLLKIKEKRSRD